MLGNIHHFIRVEVKAYNSIVTLRLFGLFLNRKAVALLVKLSYTIAFRVRDPIAKDSCLFINLGIMYGILQQFRKTCAIEDVVTKYKAHTIITDEILSNDESLGKSVRRGLLGILEVYAIVRTITKQTLKTWKVVWC